jgi:sugar/nucleoside kinase (ribokinase family)
MLKELLSKVAAGQAGNTAELAAAMGASPAMVQAMVGELERRGLLQRAGECRVACGACRQVPGVRPRACAWMLTAAGRRIFTR